MNFYKSFRLTVFKKNVKLILKGIKNNKKDKNVRFRAILVFPDRAFAISRSWVKKSEACSP